ncbi:hypothetical protein CI109_102931 [Kwoniella shandongensis]|uniref:Uncharacterized protein n=1 Tax=Kwoniella shandongensis TaxID=1734106 RepID=A0A5M6CDS5_9TREE|nr:uncharacterized protein CI109_000119 [Kwoniella shandongensis]KAA5531279.1 hypothetical protein CI109_000119 [Kwoniella shandongensis]
MLDNVLSLGVDTSPIRILYINPNSTTSFTTETHSFLSSSLPRESVLIHLYTAPLPAPPSIDGTLDGILSTQVILQHLGYDTETSTPSDRGKSVKQKLAGYSAVVVGCFSSHPLVPALREILGMGKDVPRVVGILEASIWFAMQLGPTFGIATTGPQWEPLFDEAVRTLGISPTRYTGTKGTGFNAISLHGDGPSSALLEASTSLVERGAKVIVLGCAGMAPMRADLEDKIAQRAGFPVPVVDGVQAAIDMAIGFARMGLAPTF